MAAIILIIAGGMISFEVLFGAQIRAAGSINTITEDFYSMEYKGNYELEGLLKQGGVSSDAELLKYITDELYLESIR